VIPLSRYGEHSPVTCRQVLYENDTKASKISRELTFHYNFLPKLMEGYIVGLR